MAGAQGGGAEPNLGPGRGARRGDGGALRRRQRRRCSVGVRRSGEGGGGRGAKAQRRRSSKMEAAPHREKAHRARDQGARGV